MTGWREKQNRWHPHEDKILRGATEARLPIDEVARLLPGRTVAAIKFRKYMLGYTRSYFPEKSRTDTVKGFLRPREPVKEAGVTPAAVAERDRAYSAPRTIEQVILGDPLPGRSALDRMRESEAAQGERNRLSSRHPAWSPRAW